MQPSTDSSLTTAAEGEIKQQPQMAASHYATEGAVRHQPQTSASQYAGEGAVRHQPQTAASQHVGEETVWRTSHRQQPHNTQERKQCGAPVTDSSLTTCSQITAPSHHAAKETVRHQSQSAP
jgi:hypothetical protein